jgi:hypothetical protein
MGVGIGLGLEVAGLASAHVVRLTGRRLANPLKDEDGPEDLALGGVRQCVPFCAAMQGHGSCQLRLGRCSSRWSAGLGLKKGRHSVRISGAAARSEVRSAAAHGPWARQRWLCP